jgi:hypothetical protein
MTSPVEMTYAHDSSRATAMAFLYASTEVGRTGRDGEVEVQDVAPVKVVSFGIRGRRSEARIAEARAALDAWLAQRTDLEEAGLPRVLAWNSPMVPDGRSFFEVQVPVRARPADSTTAR